MVVDNLGILFSVGKRPVLYQCATPTESGFALNDYHPRLILSLTLQVLCCPRYVAIVQAKMILAI